MGEYSDRAIEFSAVAMTDLDKDSAATHAVELLKHYGFDMGGYAAEDLVCAWSRNYPLSWLRSAVIEALYQGRYKAISVEQILTLWRRRGQPLHHFNHEFERIICSQFPTYRGILATLAEPAERTTTAPVTLADAPAHEPQNPSSVSSEVTDEVTGEVSTAPFIKVSDRPETNPHHQSSEFEQPLSPSEECLPTMESLWEVRQGELPIQTFRPKTSRELAAVDWRSNWSRTDVTKHPIHQFIPTSAGSDFYSKLKAVAQQRNSIETTASNLTVTPEVQTQPSMRSPSES